VCYEGRRQSANGRTKSFGSHDRQLARPPIQEADNPSSRFAAVVLVGIVFACAAAPSGEVPSAIGRGQRADFLIALGHGRGAYPNCATSAPEF